MSGHVEELEKRIKALENGSTEVEKIESLDAKLTAIENDIRSYYEQRISNLEIKLRDMEHKEENWNNPSARPSVDSFPPLSDVCLHFLLLIFLFLLRTATDLQRLRVSHKPKKMLRKKKLYDYIYFYYN